MKVYAHQNESTGTWIGGIEWDSELASQAYEEGQGFRLADQRRDTVEDALKDALELLDRHNLRDEY